MRQNPTNQNQNQNQNQIAPQECNPKWLPGDWLSGRRKSKSILILIAARTKPDGSSERPLRGSLSLCAARQKQILVPRAASAPLKPSPEVHPNADRHCPAPRRTPLSDDRHAANIMPMPRKGLSLFAALHESLHGPLRRSRDVRFRAALDGGADVAERLATASIPYCGSKVRDDAADRLRRRDRRDLSACPTPLHLPRA